MISQIRVIEELVSCILLETSEDVHVLRDIMLDRGIQPVNHTSLKLYDNRDWIVQVGRLTADPDANVREIALRVAKQLKPITGITSISHYLNGDFDNHTIAVTKFFLNVYNQIFDVFGDDDDIASVTLQIETMLNTIIRSRHIPNRYLALLSQLQDRQRRRDVKSTNEADVIQLSVRILNAYINNNGLGSEFMSIFINITNSRFLGGYFSKEVTWHNFVDIAFPIIFKEK